MSYLNGKNVAPRYANDARQLIGKKVEFLRNCDIDKSGRGYFFPRVGFVDDVSGRHVVIDGDHVHFSDLRELVVIE